MEEKREASVDEGEGGKEEAEKQSRRRRKHETRKKVIDK